MSNMLIGIEGISHKIKKMYVGVDGVARKIKKGYVGIDGIAHLFFRSGSSLPPGAIFNFDYTGQVQEITLPEGRYKLQCWGAQGGNSYSYSGVGSKGGYSEGIITLTEPTTLYVFVGGKGGNGSSTSLVNGGWNGGGGSVGRSSYNSGNEYGISYPACGGGGTDIALVRSDMAYSGGCTNRSAASLLSRCIVAGGGAGGSARYTEVTNTYDGWVQKGGKNSSAERTWINDSGGVVKYKMCQFSVSSYIGDNVRFSISASGAKFVQVILYNSLNAEITRYNAQSASSDFTFTLPSGVNTVECQALSNVDGVAPGTIYCYFYVYESTSSTSTGSGSSGSSQQGGGTQGRGISPGTQTSGDGGFGLGKNQTTTNYRYVSGAGGGGWYGGGSSYSDSSTGQINASGGGSGFINTPGATRPSGYTGLQLDSGATKDGATSFPAPSGSNETGHAGNGYARITVTE